MSQIHIGFFRYVVSYIQLSVLELHKNGTLLGINVFLKKEKERKKNFLLCQFIMIIQNPSSALHWTKKYIGYKMYVIQVYIQKNCLFGHNISKFKRGCVTTTLFTVQNLKKKELRVLSLFHHNHSSLALFGLFLQEVQAKTAEKVQVNNGYGETKR